MRHILALSKRELIAYFLSPVGYVVGFLFVGLYTLFFYLNFISGVDANQVLTGAIANVGVIGIFAVPFITMGLLADERKSGTIEMLMTAPVTEWEVVVGKYLGAVVYMLCLAAPSLLQIVAVRTYGVPEWGPIIASYIGILLLLTFLLSMGLFFSAISKDLLVAVMLSFVVSMVLLIMSAFVPETAPAIEGSGVFSNVLHYVFAFLRYASIGEHYPNFFQGVVNSKDVVYFASGTVFFLFLSTLALESRKWK
ncbi:MAG: ABC transporter permease subunit [Planctomycetota bacterium]|jgi:ABC-2 type transport system permease protein